MLDSVNQFRQRLEAHDADGKLVAILEALFRVILGFLLSLVSRLALKFGAKPPSTLVLTMHTEPDSRGEADANSASAGVVKVGGLEGVLDLGEGVVDAPTELEVAVGGGAVGVGQVDTFTEPEPEPEPEPVVVGVVGTGVLWPDNPDELTEKERHDWIEKAATRKGWGGYISRRGTPLHYLLMNNGIELIENIVKYWPKCVRPYGENEFFKELMLGCGRKEWISYLLDGCPSVWEATDFIWFGKSDGLYDSLFGGAIRADRIDVMRMMLARNPRPIPARYFHYLGKTSLFEAMTHLKDQSFRCLLHWDPAFAMTRDNVDTTPVFYAAGCGMDGYVKALLAIAPETVAVVETGLFGLSALMIAARNDRHVVVDVLLENTPPEYLVIEEDGIPDETPDDIQQTLLDYHGARESLVAGHQKFKGAMERAVKKGWIHLVHRGLERMQKERYDWMRPCLQIAQAEGYPHANVRNLLRIYFGEMDAAVFNEFLQATDSRMHASIFEAVELIAVQRGFKPSRELACSWFDNRLKHHQEPPSLMDRFEGERFRTTQVQSLRHLLLGKGVFSQEWLCFLRRFIPRRIVAKNTSLEGVSSVVASFLSPVDAARLAMCSRATMIDAGPFSYERMVIDFSDAQAYEANVAEQRYLTPNFDRSSVCSGGGGGGGGGGGAK